MTLSSRDSGTTDRPRTGDRAADRATTAASERRQKLRRDDYVRILKQAFASARQDNITSVAAALAYYSFLAIPSVLLVAVGIFSLVASADTVSTIVDKLGTIMPSQATTLIEQSLTQVIRNQSTGVALVVVGLGLAFWSLGGAMQNVMWGLNTAWGLEETRGFVRRRVTAWAMVVFVLVAFGLAFGLLVLGPPLSTWLGRALNAESEVTIVWWAAQWPLLVVGLLAAFAGVLWLGPNVEQRRWRPLTFGAAVAVVLWLAASGAFAFYVSRFGSYNKAWGSLAAVVILLTWFWLGAVALLFGAEIDAEAERYRESPD